MWCRKKWVAAVLGTCACGIAGIRAQQPELFELRVHLRTDQVIPSRGSFGDLKDETARLWRPYGVHIEWVDSCGGDPAARVLCVDVALTQGLDEPDRPDGATILGVAFSAPVGSCARSILVSVDATTRVLARRRTSSSSLPQIVPGRELTRALGRVVAHEIGHILLDMWFHDETGLMRATYRPHELADLNPEPFRLAARAKTRLRTLPRGTCHMPLESEGGRRGAFPLR